MYELITLVTLVMQQSFVDTVWGTIIAIMSIFTVVSGIAIFWAQKAKARLAQSNNANAKKIAGVLDQVIGALETGQQFVEATKKQEVKAKQFGEILYGVMGPKADEIRDKYEVQLKNLTADVQKAERGTAEYNEKIKALYGLLEEIGGGVVAKPPTA